MKNKFHFLAAFILVCFYSCRRDDVQAMQQPSTISSSLDYRDTITGTYSGIQIQHSNSMQWNYDITDTTACTLMVRKDSLDPNKIVLVGLPYWTTEMPEFYYPNDSTLHRATTTYFQFDEGNFTTGNPVRLEYFYGYAGTSGGTTYHFKMVKQ